MSTRALHGLGCTIAALTFALLLVGGVVHGTGSSLACPDWPLCFGEVFPSMTGGVFYEHSHRLFAALVGACTVALCVLAVRARRVDPALGWLGPAALLLVVVQGVLGGLTVIYRLPTLVSTAHLGVSLLFFATILALVWRTSARAAVDRGVGSPRAQVWASLALAAVVVQVMVGGLVRHTGAGFACGRDLLLCGGDRVWAGLPAISKLHLFHRILAVVVLVLVMIAAVKVGASCRDRTRRWLAACAPLLVVVQVLLGLLSVSSLLGLWQVTAHLGVAALLVADLWLLVLSAWPRPDATVIGPPLACAARAASGPEPACR